MEFSRPTFLISVLLFFSLLGLMHAQERSSTSTDNVMPVQWVRRARYIFEGTVLSVAPSSSTTGVATNEITFQIDRGIRGTQTGQTLTVREWAGLWASGERYHPGERVVLFLYAPSKLGLTSPVGGPLGHLPIDSAGFVQLPGGPGAGEGASAVRKKVSSRELANQVRRSLE